MFNANDAVIFAISTNKIERGIKLKKELDLPFEILSDHKKQVSRMYKVFSRYILDILILRIGLAIPSTIIVDKKGIIQFIYIGEVHSYKRASNEEILEGLKKIQNS